MLHLSDFEEAAHCSFRIVLDRTQPEARDRPNTAYLRSLGEDGVDVAGDVIIVRNGYIIRNKKDKRFRGFATPAGVRIDSFGYNPDGPQDSFGGARLYKSFEFLD